MSVDTLSASNFGSAVASSTGPDGNSSMANVTSSGSAFYASISLAKLPPLPALPVLPSLSLRAFIPAYPISSSSQPSLNSGLPPISSSSSSSSSGALAVSSSFPNPFIAPPAAASAPLSGRVESLHPHTGSLNVVSSSSFLFSISPSSSSSSSSSVPAFSSSSSSLSQPIAPPAAPLGRLEYSNSHGCFFASAAPSLEENIDRCSVLLERIIFLKKSMSQINKDLSKGKKNLVKYKMRKQLYKTLFQYAKTLKADNIQKIFKILEETNETISNCFEYLSSRSRSLNPSRANTIIVNYINSEMKQLILQMHEMKEFSRSFQN